MTSLRSLFKIGNEYRFAFFVYVRFKKPALY